MAKDPAFLFYSSDFLSGIQDLTMEERGQYITLLCLQHQKGHLTEKMIRLCLGNAAAYAGTYAAPDVMAKFRQDENGNYYNERLDVEIERRKQHSTKQRDRAINGWKKRKESDAVALATAHTMATAAAMPLENENETIDNIVTNSSIESTTKKVSTKAEEKEKLKKEKEQRFKKAEARFTESVMQFEDIYDRQMLDAFILYWTEPNKSKEKMKFEMEDTWEIKRRLAKWRDNEIKFGKKSSSVTRPSPVKSNLELNIEVNNMFSDPDLYDEKGMLKKNEPAY